MYIIIGVVAVFIFFGVAIKYFKWYFLISGYNLMSKNQKENVDIEGLGNLMGNFMFLFAAVMGLTGFFQLKGYKTIALISILSLIPIVIGLIIMAQKYDHNRQYKKGKKKEFILAIGLISLSLIIVSGFLIVGIIEPKVIIESDKIIISGQYKRSIVNSDIKEISLVENIPKVLRKINGFDFGYTLRGSFDVEGLGPANIYIQENQSPYIIITTDDRVYIINYKNPEKTLELYDQIKDLSLNVGGRFQLVA